MSTQRRVRRWGLGFWFALIGLALAWPVWAVPVTWGFTGTVTQVGGPGAPSGSVWPGASFSGQFAFNSGAVDSESDVRLGYYRGEDFLLSMQIGEFSFDSSTGGDSIEVTDFGSSPLFSDELKLSAWGLSGGSFVVPEVALTFGRPSYSVFPDDHLRIIPPPLSAFQVRQLYVAGTNYSVEGAIESLYLVPEPTMALLVAVVGSAFLRRGSRSARQAFAGDEKAYEPRYICRQQWGRSLTDD